MKRNDTNFCLTEEAFLLSSLKEVVKVSGNFSVENGKGTLQVIFQVRLPAHWDTFFPQNIILHKIAKNLMNDIHIVIWCTVVVQRSKFLIDIISFLGLLEKP